MTRATAVAVLALATTALAAPRIAQAQEAESREHTTWYFYTVKWGHQDEFLDLFQRNHYPILKSQLGTRIKSIRTLIPKNHGDGRADWTFAVELTFTGREGGPTEAEIAKSLYPDLAKFRAEERRRFEILVAHWDVPLNQVDLEKRPLSEP